MASEQTALLSGDRKASGGVTSDLLKRPSRFRSDVESKGVRPSRKSMSGVHELLMDVPRQRKPSFGFMGGRGGGGIGVKKKREARSFMQMANGSISALTPLEMGRHELYEEIPFVAVPGLQKKEHNLAVAFSSFAAFLDNEETDEYLVSTTGMGLKPEEKTKRASRMSMMLLDELEGVEAMTVSLPLVFTVLVASLITFNVGYNISVMNPSEAYAFPGHSTSMWSLAVSAFCVGGPFGAVFAGKYADVKGRKGALLLTSYLLTIGGFIQTVAPTLSLVVVARTIIGVACGAATVLVPIYLGEVAPPNLRGQIGTMTQFSLVIGILFADVIGFPFGNGSRWRYMFLLICVMGICPLMLKPFLLESPRWLLRGNPDSAEARSVIKKLRGFRYEEDVETEVEHYVNASKKQSFGDEDEQLSKEGKNATAELFADKNVRLLLVSSLALQVAQQLSGQVSTFLFKIHPMQVLSETIFQQADSFCSFTGRINAVFFYSSLFFDGVIESPLVGTALMGTINVLATYVALILMDQCGRRTLIMWSSAGMFLSCIVVILSLLGYFDKVVALAAVASYVTFFELGLGPIPALIVAEMFDGKYVAAAMSVSSQLNWVSSFVIGLLFPYMNKLLGPYSFGPFAVMLLLSFLYALIWLPETQGTTPVELQAALITKNEKVTYHNIDIEGIAHSSHPNDKRPDASTFRER